MQERLKKLPILLCFIIAFVFGMKQMREPDIWWQLLSGRWMLEHGQVTKTDIFSYTMGGVRWINVKWLYEVLIAGLEKGFGPEGIMLLQALVNVGILWVLLATLKRVKVLTEVPVSKFFTAIGVLLFFVMVEYRMAGRPEMISHLMCALMMWHFWKNPHLPWKQLILPIVLQCIWANMHEGYPVGIVMTGTFAVGSVLAYFLQKDDNYLRTAGRAAVLLAASILVLLLNPNGIQLWLQPFEIYRQVNVNKYTTELYNAWQPEYWTLQAKLYVVLLVATLAFWISKLRKGITTADAHMVSPATVFYVLILLLFGYLSLTANRNIPFAAIALFPSIPVMAAWAIDKYKIYEKGLYTSLAKNALVLTSVLLVAFYVCIVSDKYYKATKSRNRYGLKVDSIHVPIGASEFIKQHGIKGVAFSDYFVSSYLLWSLYPDFKSYIDLRDLDIFPASFFDEYFKLYQEPSQFNQLDNKYKFNYVVLSLSQLKELQKRLYWGEGYNMIYVDEMAAIFLKSTPENERLNGDLSIQKLFSANGQLEIPAWAIALNTLLNPAFDAEENTDRMPVYAARFYAQVEQYPMAIKQLLPAMPAYEDNAEAQQTMGDVYLKYARTSRDNNVQKSRLDSAYAYLDKARELDPGLFSVHSSLSGWYMSTGNYAEAARELKKCVKIDGTNDYTYYVLGLCRRVQWQSNHDEEMRDEMLEAMKRSLALNPQNSKALIYIAEAELSTGDNEDAAKHLRAALKSGSNWTPDETKLLNELKAKAGV